MHLGIPEIAFEDLEGAIAGLPGPQDVDIEPHDLAEIMFTSGTTGDPKGVMLTHRNLTANIEGVSRYISCEPSARLLSILPLSHMYEQMGGLFVTLYNGASVTYPTSRQPTVLSRTMRERKITIMLLVPQGLELLMNGIEREVARQGKQALWDKLLKIAGRLPFPLRRRLFRRVHKQFGGKLDFIVSGGAALDADLARKWELLGVKIVQGYGTTEASPVISNHTIEGRRHDSTGRPLPNVEVRISSAGEILARGENITPGYWRSPEETAKVFDGDWYKTGDLGYFDDEGFLHIQGRMKGHESCFPVARNVFPEDVQAVLTKHPQVKDASVVGLERGSSVEVHAALILDDADKAQEAIAWTNDQLAEQQRIRGFTVWQDEDFPRTHTLKVKKQVVIDTILGRLQQEPPAPTPSGGRPAGGSRGLRDIIAEVSKRDVGDIGDEADPRGRPRARLAWPGRVAVGGRGGARCLHGRRPGGPGNDGPAVYRSRGGGDEEPADDELPALGHAMVVPHDPRSPSTRSRLPPRRPSLRPEGNGPRAPGRHHRSRALRVEPQSRSGQPVDHQGRPSQVASTDGRGGSRRSLEEPGLVDHESSSGKRLPARQGGPRQAQPGEHGQDHGRRLVSAHLSGRRTHRRRPGQAFHERRRARRRRGTDPCRSAPPAHPQAGLSYAIPFFRRGSIEIRFGAPLNFPPGTDYQDATAAIEDAVKSL